MTEHPAGKETYPPGDTPFAQRMDIDPDTIVWEGEGGSTPPENESPKQKAQRILAERSRSK